MSTGDASLRFVHHPAAGADLTPLRAFVVSSSATTTNASLTPAQGGDKASVAEFLLCFTTLAIFVNQVRMFVFFSVV